jgi:hypothetical protein
VCDLCDQAVGLASCLKAIGLALDRIAVLLCTTQEGKHGSSDSELWLRRSLQKFSCAYFNVLNEVKKEIIMGMGKEKWDFYIEKRCEIVI